jgi:hypothetical protein
MKQPADPLRVEDLGADLGFNLSELRARLAKAHAGQPEHVRQYLSDLAAVMSTPEGLRVLWIVLERLGMFERCYKGNADTYYKLGRHEAAQGLFLDMADADPIRAARLITMSFVAQKPEQGETDHGR